MTKTSAQRQREYKQRMKEQGRYAQGYKKAQSFSESPACDNDGKNFWYI